jgi:CYTH domain-containing protein
LTSLKNGIWWGDLEIGSFSGIILTMSKATEIERKFLVTKIPKNLEKGVAIAQGYLYIGTDGSETRIRRKGEKYFVTKKSGGDLQRQEDESEISEREFSVLWPSTNGRTVEKTRYEIPYEGKIIELDIYGGGLLGLVTAEVEFDSVEEGRSFTPPEFLGKEVTTDKSYKNQQLAVYGIPG